MHTYLKREIVKKIFH